MDFIKIKGAREHNLKNIDVDIPRNKLAVITGVSGSGKSTLAFDTIYAEGQRRYVESLSAYARQFLGLMSKPDVDSIEGLSPAISIQQKAVSNNPRSTVGTITEIYDYLRLLFARVGIAHCPKCGKKIEGTNAEAIVEAVLKEKWRMVQIFAPVVRAKKGTYETLLEDLKKDGFSKARVNGKAIELSSREIEKLNLAKYEKHDIDVLVDKIFFEDADRTRLQDSVETALKIADGLVIVQYSQSASSAGLGKKQGAKNEDENEKASEVASEAVGKTSSEKEFGFEATEGGASGVDEKAVAGANEGGKEDEIEGESEKDGGKRKAGASREQLFSRKNSCPDCGVAIEEIQPRLFSFNSPFGACAECNGLGVKQEFDPELVIPDKSKSLIDGAIAPWNNQFRSFRMQALDAVSRHHGFDIYTPIKKMKKEQVNILLNGSKDRIQYDYKAQTTNARWTHEGSFEGVIPWLERTYAETESDSRREEFKKYIRETSCPKCEGRRLNQNALSVKIAGKNIVETTDFNVGQSLEFFNNLKFSEKEKAISKTVLKEINSRLLFLHNVGLSYLSLSRSAGTLSGGEAQRIRLATQIGSNLTGVLYVLDEPSIGLHQRDNKKLLDTLKRLRDLGNTVIVVEHDEETIRAADFVADLGPGAGVHGGRLVAKGTPRDIMDSKESVTGAFLRREREVKIPRKRREYYHKLLLKGAKENNLKKITVGFPLGTLTCVTGVSGSGKSTLVMDVLYKALSQKYLGSKEKAGAHESIEGLGFIDNLVLIDQSPIGRTPRSNPATYTGVFTPIRELFASTPEARARGYDMGRFSFNVDKGRCQECQGDGVIKIEMQFLPDVYVQCERCKGKRYDKETLSIRYKGKSISDVLDMTVDEALKFFENIPPVRGKLETIADVGLGYIKLGQQATTLSGGEAQRIKLSAELSKKYFDHALYLLDEPTTGLHFSDVEKLLEVLHRLVEKGNTVLVIEHNLDVIKTADYIIDLGPEGGDAGGQVVATGTPEEVAKNPQSYTGQFLKKVLA